MPAPIAKKRLPKWDKRAKPKGRKSNKVANTGLSQRNISGPRFIKLRYAVNFTGTISVDGIDILGACGAMSISTSQASTIYTRARIHYVSLIGTPPQPGQINEAKLEFGTSHNSQAMSRDVIVNSSNNPNVGPKLYAKPRTGVPASDWFSSALPNIMSINAPINSILEIGVSVMDYEPGATTQYFTGSFTSAGIYLKKSPDTNLQLLI